MLHQIVEIQTDNRYLSLERGFLVIHADDAIISKVPLDDIAVLLLSGNGISISKNIITELSLRGSIVIFCGKNYVPQSIVIPVNSNYQLNAVLNTQIRASIPFKKNIWKQIVVAKLQNQTKALLFFDIKNEAKLLTKISTMVKSGDVDNREAYGAKIYWQALFGNDFRRDINRDGINSLLNYAYAIIRASMIRALFSVGLQPALGVHHDNKVNAFCLADDFMEIYRPITDVIVKNLSLESKNELTPEVKKVLIESLWVKINTVEGYSPVFQSMYYMAMSYVRCLKNKENVFELPLWEGKNEKIPNNEQV